MFPLTHFLFFNPVSYGSYLSFLAQLFVADPAWQEYLQNPAETSCLNEDVYFWGDGGYLSHSRTQNHIGGLHVCVCFEYHEFGLGPDI